MVTTDASGNVLGPARLFSMNPPQNEDSHNYTGFPRYQGGRRTGCSSRDATYFYTTAISSCVVTEVPPQPTCPGADVDGVEV